MPSNADRRPKIPTQRSSDTYYAQLHLQDPHLYPSFNPYPLPPRDDSLSYSYPSNPNQTANTRPPAPTIRPDVAPPATQKPSSRPSDAALFWSFVSRQIRKRKARSRAKKAQATTTTASDPTDRPIPIVYPSSTDTAPPSTSTQQPYSLFRAYRRQQKEKKTRARKALISAPLKGGVTVVRTDSGNEYSYPEPRAETGVVRVLKSRGGTKRGRGVVMSGAASKAKVAGLRELEKRAVVARRMPSEAGVVGLGIDLGDGKVGAGREKKGARMTRWGDFLGKSSQEERESERRRATRFAPTTKTGGDAYGARTEQCRICHETLNTRTKESRSSSGVCGRCQSEYSSPYTPPFSLSDNLPPIPHLKDSRLYAKPNFPPSAHPDALFADFDSDSSHPQSHPRYPLNPFDSEPQFEPYDSRPLAQDDDRQTLLSNPYPSTSTSTSTSISARTPTTTRRGAVSAASPTAQTHSRSRRPKMAFPTAPPIPDDDEYTSRKYGPGRKRSGKEEKRRSSFYNFWDEVLAGTRTSLAARRGYDAL